MALGSMASLGVGSELLTWDNLKQIQENEEKNRVEPITKNMKNNMDQQTELALLKTELTTLNNSFKALSDYSTFQQRKASVEGSGVKASAGAGLAVQDIKINVSQLAQNDVNQVGKKFASRDSIFSSSSQTLSFYHNGTSYNINISAGMSVGDVAQAITDQTDGKVMGIMMKTGGDEPYQLMIQSKDSGADNKIYFGNTLNGVAMPGGKLAIDDSKGGLQINIGGSTITLNQSDIDGKTTETSSAEENAAMILEALNNKINTDASLADLKSKVDSGEITIKLNSAKTGLMLNDSQGRSISVNTDAVTIQTLGTSPQSTDLGFAQKSVKAPDQVVGNMAVSNGALSGSFKISVGSTTETIDLANLSGSGSNAEKIAEAINNLTSLNIEAKVENGKLVMNSKNGEDIRFAGGGATAEENAKIMESIGLSATQYLAPQNAYKELNITNIQSAQNAKFTYNGIVIERDKNEVDDVVSGLSLELTAVSKPNEDVILRIARDDEGIAEEMQKFVDQFNVVYNKITELIKYDEETEVTGVFNGNSDIRGILRQLNNVINSNDVQGMSLVEYGVYLNEDGTLKLDKEKFEESFKEDPDKAVSFFRSQTSISNGVEKEVDGVFTKLRNVMDRLITGESATLKLLETSLSDGYKKLEDEKKTTQESIDTKYETMATRWSLYDQMLAQIQQTSNYVTNMINMSLKS